MANKQEVKTTMTIQQLRQDTLDAILGDFKDYGFSLREPDTDTAELSYKGKVIARYNQAKLTIPVLLEGCRNYLKNMGGLE